MSSSETLNNLNIRKFSSRSKLKAAQDVGVNDLCVVTDNSEAVLQIPVPPTPNEENLGEIYMATTTSSGETGDFVEGYFYKCVGTTTPSSAVATQTAGTSLSNITVNVETLEEFFGWTTDNSIEVAYTENGWSIEPMIFGVTYTGTPVIGDRINTVYTAAATTYTWEQTDVQPAGATYTAGNGISIDANNEISVTDPVLVNTATGTHSVAIGESATAVGNNATAVGTTAQARASGSLAIGQGAYCTATNSIMICARGSYGTLVQNSDPNTVKIHNGLGKYEIMSADGTVPTARLTKVNTTTTLAVADWSSNTQTVTVSGVKADSVVFVSPASASASDYASAGILCTAQAADSLTFTCTTTPTNAITVNVVCM